jgi:hypothetical protein
MSRSRDADRLRLAVVGAVLVILGGAGLLRSYGAWGDREASDPILLAEVRSFVDRSAAWFWPLAIVAALLVAYVGYRWLRVELRFRARREPLRVRDGQDRLEVDLSALDRAVAADIGSDAAVREAEVSITNAQEQPTVRIDLAVDEDIAIPRIRAMVEERALEHLRAALESDQVHAFVRVRFEEPSRRLA